MRRFDKKLNMVKANILAESRYMESKGLIKEGIDDNPVDSRRQEHGDYEAGQQDYEDMDALKHDINSEKATTSWKKLMVAARQGVSPYSLVVVDKVLRKVVKQEINIKTGQAIPAHYESLRKEFPNALIHLEDSEGSRLWSN